VCNLDSRSQKTLSDLSAFVRACARKAITIRDVIDAYTIGGARFLGREKQAGSIEVGKSGDFIVLDQDILRLADEGHAEDIRNTNVLETWFMGKRIYVSKVRKSSAMRGLTK
jgi:predicted amidohydrolase YtcJ